MHGQLSVPSACFIIYGTVFHRGFSRRSSVMRSVSVAVSQCFAARLLVQAEIRVIGWRDRRLLFQHETQQCHCDARWPIYRHRTTASCSVRAKRATVAATAVG